MLSQSWHLLLKLQILFIVWVTFLCEKSQQMYIFYSIIKAIKLNIVICFPVASKNSSKNVPNGI